MILARTQNEMKRAAYCAVQMIQNVSKNRTNKVLTMQDVKNIALAVTIVLPFFHKALKNGNFIIGTPVALVEGTDNDKCFVKWLAAEHLQLNINNSGKINHDYRSAKGDNNIPGWGTVTLSTLHEKNERYRL